MVKKNLRKKKHRSSKHRKISELKEEQNRTLFIRFPKQVKSVLEVHSLFPDNENVRVKVPRQSKNYCHVVFPTVDEKVENLDKVKEKLIDGKPIFVSEPRPINFDKIRNKKIKIPEPKDEPGESKYLFVTNIAPGVKASEISDAFPGSVTIALLKGLVRGKRQAKVKMSEGYECKRIVQNKSEWPTFKGVKVKIMHNVAKAKRKPRKKKEKTDESLKIYDGDIEIKDEVISDEEDNETKKNDKDENQESLKIVNDEETIKVESESEDSDEIELDEVKEEETSSDEN